MAIFETESRAIHIYNDKYSGKEHSLTVYPAHSGRWIRVVNNYSSEVINWPRDDARAIAKAVLELCDEYDAKDR